MFDSVRVPARIWQSGPVTFQPVRGKVVLWPSVLADRPDVIDPRTHHEALPVTKGEKFGGMG